MTTDQNLAQQAARFAAQAAEQIAQRAETAQAARAPKVAPWVARAQAGTLPPKVYR